MRQLDQDLLRFAQDANTLFSKGRQGSELKYLTIFDLFLKEGGIFKSDPYTKAEEKQILNAIEETTCPFKMQQCYYNAQTIAQATDLGYAEGYVASAKVPVPLEHAWNTLPSGKVVDLTIRKLGAGETQNPKKLLERAKENQANSYLGIRFPEDEIRKSWLRNKMSQMLLEDPVMQEKIYEHGYPASWKSSSMSGPRPEEEWLNEPEREGFPPSESRSPFEGDIPPWGQRGYQPIFPMRAKVFYITAYVGSGPRKISRKPTPAKSPVMGAARPVKDVGSMPAGTQFGSSFMYHPFAAIPVRKEDFAESGPVVDYLASLIEELGAFGKILMEHSFPDPNAKEVRLSNGRWMPVDMTGVLYGGITYINAYNVNRFYGGPHEGGWWYDAGEPIASVPLREEDPTAVIEWDAYLREKVGWTSQHDRYSVLGHDEFEVRPDDYFARFFPEETPHYE
jgi:hypothetical protein